MENSYGKINILLQTYISRGEVDSFSLISDLSYVAQVSKTPPSPLPQTVQHIQVLDVAVIPSHPSRGAKKPEVELQSEKHKENMELAVEA